MRLELNIMRNLGLFEEFQLIISYDFRVAIEIGIAELALVGISTGKVLLGLFHLFEGQNKHVKVLAY
jgi:hypothetical protein